MQFPESQVQTFNTQFQDVVYNAFGTYPAFSGQLAPITGVYPNPTYICGTILAQYNLNAPSPSLVGQFVNYSAASANLDQQVPVALLIQQWVNTIGGDLGFYQITFLQPPLELSGTQLSIANASADVTAFLAAIPNYAPPIGSILGASLNGQNDQVYFLK